MGYIVFFAFFGIPAIYVVLAIVGEMRAEAREEKIVASTWRKEVLDGREYAVVTRKLSVARERSTGRIGIVMERGRETESTTIDGELTLVPRWIKVQFVRKTDGKAGRIEWRSYEKFEIIGAVDVDFLTHRAGFLRTDTFIRYPRVLL